MIQELDIMCTYFFTPGSNGVTETSVAGFIVG
jgi:hypothetical protein